MLAPTLFQKKEEYHALQFRLRWCSLLVLFFSFFCSVQLASQTVVKLMAPQAEQLQINIEDQQYFGDAIQFTLGREPYVTGGTSPYDYEWTHNSTFFSNEASILVTTLQNDLYSLTVSDSLGCTAEKDIRLKIETGTYDPVLTKINIYPNPARDYIHIAVSGDLLRFNAVLYNNLGAAVWKGEINNNGILPLHYSPGFYLLQIIDEQQILEKKIIIH